MQNGRGAIMCCLLEVQNTWANDRFSRLSAVIDLPAAEAVYHQSCNANFRTGKQIPKACQKFEAAVSNDCATNNPGRPGRK